MNENTQHLREPTVDDLRVKLCYICREEERHDNRPDPPPVWTHPCKCTLVAHESCLLHWINTQQRDFGRSRGELKCPQCGAFYEFEGYNPRILRILNSANRALSRSGRVIIGFCAGTIIVSFGAGLYLTCATYGAFAVREFLGPDMFHALLTANPTRWPWHAWVNLPLIPFSLIASRTPLLLWTTTPLVPLLFPWPTSAPIASQVASGSNGALRLVHPTRLSMWPPPPALVCALFPFVRALYEGLRARVTRALVQDDVPPRPQTAQQQQQEQQRQQQDLQRRREERLVLLRQLAGRGQLPQGWPQQQQQQQQPQQPQPQRQPQEQPNQEQQQRHQPERRFQFQVGDQFHLEITHFIFNRNAHAPAADAPGPAAIAGPAGNVADQQPQQPAQEEQPPAEPEPQQPNPPDAQEQQQPEEQPQPPQQEQQQQQQEQQGEQGQREQPQQEEQGQGQAAQPLDDNNFGAVAARAIRVTGASLGRLIGGALAMPTIARVMGAMLLRLSHVVPLVRIIIAPRLRPASPGLVGLWGRAGSAWRLFGGDIPAVDGGWAGGAGLGAKVLSGFLATSQEWATSDPVWWRNALGLGVFLVVKDGLKILHLRLAKKELEERHIKNKSFSGVDLTGLDLIEQST